MDYPVLVINLNRSVDRLRNVEAQLGKDSFIRIEGIDGKEWESEECDSNGRPFWKAGIKRKFKEEGLLSAVKIMQLIPGEVGCALSHRKAWQYIVDNKLESAVILEDDFGLTKEFKGSFLDSIDKQGGLPEDADVLFLSGKDNKHSHFKLDKKNRILSGQCNTGYVITLEGAKKAIESQFPMYMACDMQWWRVAFKNIERPFNIKPDIKRGYAYAVKKSVIVPSEFNNNSTMTPSGKKPWQLPQE